MGIGELSGTSPDSEPPKEQPCPKGEEAPSEIPI